MGCSNSKENDKTAAGTTHTGQTYTEQAEDAASMLSGAGAPFYSCVLELIIVQRVYKHTAVCIA